MEIHWSETWGSWICKQADSMWTREGDVESAFIAQPQQNRCFSEIKCVEIQQSDALQLLSLQDIQTVLRLHERQMTVNRKHCTVFKERPVLLQT